MRKDVFLPVLALLGGGAGFALRYWQLATALDGHSMLFRAGAPATSALIGLLVVLAAVFLLLSRGGTVPTGYPQAFYCPSALYMTLMTAGGFLLLGSAALGVLESMEQLQYWRAALTATLPLMPFLTAFLAIPAGMAALLLGKGNYRAALPEFHPLLATLPAYALLPWIVALYQANSCQPETMLFVFTLLGVICAELSFYGAACFAFGRPHPIMCLAGSLMGVVLMLTSLADRPTLFYSVMCLGCVVLMLAQSHALLRCMFGPVRPDPVQSTPTAYGED